MIVLSRPSIVALLLVVAATARAADGAPSDAAPGDDAPAALANPLAAQALERLSATRERPLFSPSRRPPPPPPVARAPGPPPPPPPPPPPNVVLIGVVMDSEETRAVVRATDQILRLQIGDDVGGWKVAQIEGRKMVLSLDDRFATFTLFSGEPGAAEPSTLPSPPRADKAAATPSPQSKPPPTQAPSTRRSRNR